MPEEPPSTIIYQVLIDRPRQAQEEWKITRWETVAWETACLGNYLPTLPRTTRCPTKTGVWGRPTRHNSMQLELEPDKMYQEQWSAEMAPSNQP